MTLKNITIVKIGGNVVDDPEALRRFAAGFAQMPGRRILVHGGGKEATRMSQALGLTTTMIDGRRVTDASTLDIVTMVYSGLVNKRIVLCCRASTAMQPDYAAPMPDWSRPPDVRRATESISASWAISIPTESTY